MSHFCHRPFQEQLITESPSIQVRHAAAVHVEEPSFCSPWFSKRKYSTMRSRIKRTRQKTLLQTLQNFFKPMKRSQGQRETGFFFTDNFWWLLFVCPWYCLVCNQQIPGPWRKLRTTPDNRHWENWQIHIHILVGFNKSCVWWTRTRVRTHTHT